MKTILTAAILCLVTSSAFAEAVTGKWTDTNWKNGTCSIVGGDQTLVPTGSYNCDGGYSGYTVTCSGGNCSVKPTNGLPVSGIWKTRTASRP